MHFCRDSETWHVVATILATVTTELVAYSLAADTAAVWSLVRLHHTGTRHPKARALEAATKLLSRSVAETGNCEMINPT